MSSVHPSTRVLRVALLGCGNVGTQVARLLATQGAELSARIGAPVELAGIAVRRLGRERDLDAAVRQEGRGDDAQLVVMTHRAPDSALSSTVAGLREMDMVRDVSSVMRVEGEPE